ncbi:anti-sigma factor family protein [Pseudoalteromonas lipolytica]
MIDDQTLSAFLDNELSAQEMERVRSAIAQNEDLAIRLAELSEVDLLVKQHAEQIDAMPLSKSLEKTLGKQTNDTVVSLSKWQKIKQASRKQLAVAAGIAVLFTVGVASLTQQQQLNIEQPIANALEQQLSGDKTNIDSGRSLTAQLSFINSTGDFCRQYTLYQQQTQQSHIACKEHGTWQLKVSTEQKPYDRQTYSLASNTSALDTFIDNTIKGQPLDRTLEQQARENKWQ